MARAELTPQELKNRNIISSRINKLINEKKISQAEISRRTGIPRSTLTGYVKATSTPNAGNIQKLSDLFGVSKSDIDPRFSEKPSNVVEVKEFIKIPILGEIACGDPITAEQNVVGYRLEASDSLPVGNIFYLKTKGDSMSPTIPQNSYVMIREQGNVEDGEIAAVLVNGDEEATLKRVKHQGNLVLLIADNPSYDPYIVTEENPARILGKAIKFSMDL